MLGERIRQTRLEQGLSQRQLCGKEITRNMLSQIESGKARPSMQTLTYLAQTLGKPVSFFLEETVTPAGEPRLQEARELYSRGEYRECLELLETVDREKAGEEERLLQLLATLELAKESIGEGRKFYAKSILEKLEQTAEGAVYYTPALERERLLLLYEAGAAPLTLVEQLPDDHREILLRAQAAVEQKDYIRCGQLVSALPKHTAQSRLLMGQALSGQGMYREAIPHLEQAEEQYPLPAAKALEICYRELEDYKKAYEYACKQKQ